MADGSTPNRLFAADALLPGGWARDVLLAWDAQGRLTQAAPGTTRPAGVPQAAGAVIPGLPNLHSHAFQRAFAGLTEYRSALDAIATRLLEVETLSKDEFDKIFPPPVPKSDGTPSVVEA